MFRPPEHHVNVQEVPPKLWPSEPSRCGHSLLFCSMSEQIKVYLILFVDPLKLVKPAAYLIL